MIRLEKSLQRKAIRFWGWFDLPFIISVVALAGIGLIGIYSATLNGPSFNLFSKQMVWLLLGGLIFFFLSLSDYRVLNDHAFTLYSVSIVGLIAVLLFGVEIHGSRSWIRLAGISLQPSEFAKISLVLVVARYLSGQSETYLSKTQILALSCLILLPTLLVMLQGDLGTGITYLPIVVGAMFVAGLTVRIAFTMSILILLSSPLAWFTLRGYQQQRILATLNPSLDPQGVGYQTSQSVIAIGSSGLTGKGFGNGFQSQLGFVPEIHSDFVYALLTEEWGLWGGGLILGLYFILIHRLTRMGGHAQDRAGILLITGVTSLLGFHILINIGMALGICPPVGIPLPLLSYGGSSTITFMSCLGLASSVYRRRFVYTDP